MSVHDNIPRTQFGPVQFPAEQHRLGGKYRHHTHEYPHTPGGDNEKLGRGLYDIMVRGNFQATFPAYPGLYPDGMNQLRSYYEQGVTLQFTHPTAGQFPAFIVSWDQVKDPKIRSGEKVDIGFKEDQPSSFALAQTLVAGGHTGLAPSAQQLATDLAAAQSSLTLSQNDLSIFDAIQNTVQQVLAVQDTRDLYGNLYASKIAAVISQCQQLDASMNLQDARAWPVVDSLQGLWLQSQLILKDLQSNRVQLQDYVVPFTMPLLQVAKNLYGDASRQSDLLSLNADRIDDPLRIPANTDLRYYPLTPQQSATNAAA